MITQTQFQQMINTNPKATDWYSIAMTEFPKYDVTTTNRIAGFMAQAGHESSDFKTLEENLNYSETGLLKTFGRYFDKATAKQYARKPEMIANRVYDDALRTNKLGNTKPGDGWRFRGRGIFQLTGRWNYEAFGKTVGKTAEEAAEYLTTKEGAMESALWYWKKNNLNRFADADDINGLSRAVNGGDTGLAERASRYARNKVLIEGLNVQEPPAKPAPAVTPVAFQTLGRGSRGEDVKKLQKALGLAVDGGFGIMTEEMVRSWQRNHKYSVTGKVDQQQFKQIVGA